MQSYRKISIHLYLLNQTVRHLNFTFDRCYNVNKLISIESLYMSLLLCLLHSQYIIWRYYAVYPVRAHFYGAVVSVTISYWTIFMLRKKDTPHGHVMPSILMAGSQCTVSKLMKEGTFTSSYCVQFAPKMCIHFLGSNFYWALWCSLLGNVYNQPN